MKIVETNSIKYCVFDNIEKTDFVKHCFTTRIGGVSTGVFDSLNVSYTRDDIKENVDENLQRLSKATELDFKNIVSGHQIHKKDILYADYNHCGIYHNGFDGYITDKPGIVLCTYHADCVPIFFADANKKVIGLCHSGWRGTVLKIAEETVEKMVEVFGCDKKDIVIGIGPSIGKCCFQIDEPVVCEFNKNLPYAMDYINVDDKEKDHYKADLWSINKRILMECGIPEENIEITDKCTMCNGDLFYSHRRMGSHRGSMAAYIAIKE